MAFSFKTIIAILCSMMLFLVTGENTPAAKANSPLRTAMQATEAQLAEWSINGWVKLPSGELTDTQLGEIIEQTMRELGCPQDYKLKREENSKYKVLQAEGLVRGIQVVTIVRIVAGLNNPGEKESFLVINAVSKAEGIDSIENIQDQIDKIIKKNGPAPQITTCLIGWLDGKLKDREWCDALESAFNAIDAQVIDKLETQHFASYTGFSPGIINRVQVGDQKINLNMAMRYSQYDNRTYITIGSPIITREY